MTVRLQTKSRAISLLVSEQEVLLVDVLSQRDKVIFLSLVGIWAIALVWFWAWWLQTENRVSVSGTVITSLLIAWNTLLPGYYFFFAAQMKRSNPKIALPSNWRVAMVVTKAPSEPWAIVRKTLEAMLSQSHPHDTWLADEDPQPETIAWCRKHRVRISTRKGIQEYHRSNWPRRTKCKEGNLAYFYDKYGYEKYDFVAQLDADHVPEPGYLKAMLRPFVDPKVGYVAAPSICDANAHESWVVNARLFAEATLHGSLQAGYNNGWAPLCIGSHYAVRTAALKEIGGLGAELAEDHTTTLMMNSYGWKGVFAFDAEAHGDGPGCFADFLVQEYQWSRSLMMVLLAITPRYWRGLTPRLKFQFLFAQVWYPIFGLTILAGVLMPPIALIFDMPWVQVSWLEFVARSTVLSLACLLPVAWVATRGCLRPHNAKIVSWEMLLFQFARWPWILAGVFNATVSWILQKELPFRVTPKGANAPKPLPFKVLTPYLLLAVVAGLTVIAVDNVIHAKGYYFLTLLNAGIYIGLALAIVWLHVRENANHAKKLPRYLPQKLAIALSALLMLFAVGLRMSDGVEVMARNAPLPRSMFGNFLR